MEGKGTQIHLAVFAGILATTGSLFGKVAGSFDIIPLVSSRKEMRNSPNKKKIYLLFFSLIFRFTYCRKYAF